MRTFLAVALLASTGCGTVVNLVTPAHEGKVYGGVRNDLDLIEKIFEGQPSDTNPGGAAVMLMLAVIALPFLDLPLSAIGDTLTLPITRRLDR